MEWHDANYVSWVCRLEAHSVMVDADRDELTDPLVYGDSRDSERAEGTRSPGGGVREWVMSRSGKKTQHD